MLAKNYRLRRNVDVLRVLKKGRFVGGGMVNLKYLVRSSEIEKLHGLKEKVLKQVSAKGRILQNDGNSELETESSRIAVVVSKKVFKRAVDRNRAKRLVRESVRLLVDKIKPGYDLVFLVQSSIVERRQFEVQKDIEFVLRKVGLMLEF